MSCITNVFIHLENISGHNSGLVWFDWVLYDIFFLFLGLSRFVFFEKGKFNGEENQYVLYVESPAHHLFLKKYPCKGLIYFCLASTSLLWGVSLSVENILDAEVFDISH